MKSLKELFQTGCGPSSSHTMAPQKIALFFRKKYPDKRFRVILYGSLAHTGKGHGTDTVLKKVLGEDAEIVFNMTETNIEHPNTLDFEILDGTETVARHRAYSLGGGAFSIVGEPAVITPEVYPHDHFSDIKAYCLDRDIRLSDYVFETEPDIKDYLETIWDAMTDSIKRGLSTEGVLPGGLNVRRKARYLYLQRHIDESPETRENRLVCSYAFAVAEENAAGGTIVTAPTCGSSGVLPANERSNARRDNKGACGSGAYRRSYQEKRFHIRSGMRLPGGDRKCLRYGGGRTCGDIRARSRPDRIRYRNIYRTSFGAYLRSRGGARADTLHRT